MLHCIMLPPMCDVPDALLDLRLRVDYLGRDLARGNFGNVELERAQEQLSNTLRYLRSAVILIRRSHGSRPLFDCAIRALLH
jgi:hypothetical protein